MFCQSGFLEEKIGKTLGKEHESVRITLKARVRTNGSLFQPFLCTFRWRAGCCPQWWVVRNNEVSARRELTVR